MRNFIRWCHFIGYALSTVLLILYGVGVASVFGDLVIGDLGIQAVGGVYIVFAFLSALLTVLKFKHIKGSLACGITCAVFDFLVAIPTILLAVMLFIESGNFTYLEEVVSNIISLIIVVYAIPV